MKKLKSYIGLTLLGGMLVILPFTVLVLVVTWVWNSFGRMIEPISVPITNLLNLPPIAADFLVLLSFLVLCLVVGLVVRTTVGRWLHMTFDNWMTRIVPGYRTIREMIKQILGGGDDSLTGEVVRAHIFGEDCPSMMVGILTSKHDNGLVTVYVPTAPIPTSGLTYHIPESAVEYLDNISVEEAMRTVIACGAGSADMLKEHRINKLSGQETKSD